MNNQIQPTEINPGIYKFGDDITILVAGPKNIFIGFNKAKFNMRDIDRHMGTIRTTFPGMEVLAISSGSSASYTPLQQSQELRDLIREIVKQEIDAS